MRAGCGFLMVALLAACGPKPDLTLEPPTGPAFRLEGACSPSTVSRSTVLDARPLSCVRGTPAPTLVESRSELEALLEPNCTADVLGTIDFVTQHALVVSTRGASEWFVFPNFVHQRSDAVEVGLVIRPQGSPPPDSIIVLPRDGLPVELRWCRSVCTARCDQAIP